MASSLAPFPSIPIDVRFGIGGNADGYQGAGWSFPETGFTWSLGPRSILEIPCSAGWDDILLVLEGSPFLHAAAVVSQRVTVSTAGVEVDSFVADEAFTRPVRLSPRNSTGVPIVIELRYPDRASPSRFGADDRRELAIAWRRIRVARLRRKREPQDGNSEPNGTPRRVGDNSDGPLVYSNSAQKDLGSQTIDEFVLGRLMSSEPSTTVLASGTSGGSPSVSIEIDPALTDDISVARCTVDERGSWTIGFSPAWSGRGRDAAAVMVVWHWLATMPILEAYSASGSITGSFMLSLGDEAHGRGVAFCSNTREALLIPDPYFMRTIGYRDLRRAFASGAPPFTDRTRSALWRGSTTGYRGPDGLLGLPRIRLCRRALQPDAGEFIDAGLTGFVQLDHGEEEMLRKMGLAREFIPPENLPRWMFHIDIDGNTNSWPGLFQKLLSGSVVMKVTSTGPWRQWYYDRLEAHTNIMPIAADFTDLTDKVKYLASHTDESATLAQGALSLTRSMSYGREVDLAVDTLESAIVQEWLRAADPVTVHDGPQA